MPNTISIAREPSHDARIITEALEPHRIIFVNQPWCDMTGFSAEQLLGLSLAQSPLKALPLILSPSGMGVVECGPGGAIRPVQGMDGEAQRIEDLLRHVKVDVNTVLLLSE